MVVRFTYDNVRSRVAGSVPNEEMGACSQFPRGLEKEPAQFSSRRMRGAWPRTDATATGCTLVTNCNTTAQLQELLKHPARLKWHEVKKVEHYYLSVNAVRQPMQVREAQPPYGGGA